MYSRSKVYSLTLRPYAMLKPDKNCIQLQTVYAIIRVIRDIINVGDSFIIINRMKLYV
jgi:hypothetical protein